MSVSSIGLTTVTPTTGTGAGRTESPASQESSSSTFKATETPDAINQNNQGNGAEKTAERVNSPATMNAAKLRGYGDFVDKRV